jgi:chromosome partitioning protein
MVPDVPGPSARTVVHRRRRVQYRMSDENSSESPDLAEPTASEGRVDRPFPGGQYVVPAPAVVEPSEPSTEVVELTEEELDADPDEMSDEDAAAVLSLAVSVEPEQTGRPVPPLPRIIAVASQKGGVGKTTTSINLSAFLADLGHRVLVVDLDPQGNATTGLGFDRQSLERDVYDVLLNDVPLLDAVEPTSVKGLFCAPSGTRLKDAELELAPAMAREMRLRTALAEVSDDFDYVLIDCPPSFSLLTKNGLVAANEVLIPVQCEYYALEGLAQLLEHVDEVRRYMNPTLDVSTIVLVMYDGRTQLAKDVVSEVTQYFGEKVCRNKIPRTVKLAEAPSFGQPISVHAPGSRGAVAYKELAREVSGVA